MDAVGDQESRSALPLLTIRLEHLDDVFLCKPGQSLMLAVNSAAVRVAEGCRGGGCGVCRIRILSGQATFGRMSAAHLSPALRADGWTLACRTYPATDMLVAIDGAGCI